jgi:hypothetical protein
MHERLFRYFGIRPTKMRLSPSVSIPAPGISLMPAHPRNDRIGSRPHLYRFVVGFLATFRGRID